MSNIAGYISSFFMTFSLGVGFAMGGIIFVALFSYVIMLIFKRSRHFMDERQNKSFASTPRKFVPVRNSPRPAGPTNIPKL